ncbi:MAG TPA: serine hydrolase domain-containing protein [Magnetospirillaceae bacterium]|nr:serine hydrolase domain-containing protein [Magnetospirillaceae bacterium]
MRILFVLLLWCVSRLALAAPAPTAAELDAFFDGYVPAALARGDVAGAALVVVKDGQVLFEKGYGLADMANKKPVDPKNTLFRAGGVSAVATWVAVMQLVDQGKLDLDRDINDYLDFRIPPTWPKQITLRDLMTQQSGFEEIARNVVTDRAERLQPLDVGARLSLPERIFPAGQVPAYSDYGVALAGLIVERVGGQPFERYVADHLFQPLGMTRASFTQPLPPPLAGSLASGYRRASEPAETFDYYWMSPARGLSASADDMGRLMLALLGSGAGSGAQILSPASVTALLTEDRRRDPNIRGVGLGLTHLDRNGHAVMGVIGETASFRAVFALMPEASLGVYFVQNGTGNRAGDLRTPLMQAFMDRYFPAPAQPSEATQASAAADGALVSGAYWLSRRAEGSFLRLASLRQAIVSQLPDGSLSVDMLTDQAHHPKIWHEIKPNLWREENGTGLLAVRLDAGHPAEIITDALPPSLILTPAPPLRSAIWSVPLLIVTLALLAAMLVLMPLRGMMRLAYRARGDHSALIGGLVWLVALIDLLFLGGFAGFICEGTLHPSFFSADQDWMVETLHALGFAAVAGVLVTIFALRAGNGRRGSLLGRLGGLIPLLTSLSVVWFGVIYHLIGWSIAY